MKPNIRKLELKLIRAEAWVRLAEEERDYAYARLWESKVCEYRWMLIGIQKEFDNG